MMTIAMIVFGLGVILAGLATAVFRGAFYERERGRLSHVAGQDAKRLADQYHSAGKVMYRQALDSYEEGQEFWRAATEALLDAKRREARVEKWLADADVYRALEIVNRKEAV